MTDSVKARMHLAGALICAGEVDLLLAVQKLLPGPDRAERTLG
jgi:hypothetical protein